MVEIKTQLRLTAAYDLVADVIQKAAKQFNITPSNDLEEIKIGSNTIEFETFEMVSYPYTDYSKNLGTWYRPKFAEKERKEREHKRWSYVIVVDIESENDSATALTIKSYKHKDKDYDDVAIWIAHQLDKYFPSITLMLNDPTKLQATSTCAYCGSTQTACVNCGAPLK